MEFINYTFKTEPILYNDSNLDSDVIYATIDVCFKNKPRGKIRCVECKVVLRPGSKRNYINTTTIGDDSLQALRLNKDAQNDFHNLIEKAFREHIEKDFIQKVEQTPEVSLPYLLNFFKEK
ncbi:MULTISPECIES: hypothetical protein [Bacillus cereus group]|uniref:Uncharacterized protein n=1 Tax=Bacillus thuringiensis TaxID=1428 RepID=A0A9X6WHY6_BACTU|nr:MULTISPECIES: hypothetical protein [Bacillus cereus group]PFJ31900.1 hypothetical protein COJ15_29815 [Bacillus thuringiensis]PGP12686.1 hypothetical protein COA01_33245 [Bacillus cereus]